MEMDLPIKKARKKHQTTEITFTKHPNFNSLLTDILADVGRYEGESGQMHKFNAYDKAVKALAALDYPVQSGKEAIKIDGIGAKLGKKIDEILETGKLVKLEKLKKDPELAAIRLVSRVSGIGPKSAMQLVKEKGVKTLDDLRAQNLNQHQAIGLKYFDDFEQRIPRDEMIALQAVVIRVLQQIDPLLIGTTCGSFRRGSESSGDLDVMITHPSYVSSNKNDSDFLERIVQKLQEEGFLTDHLSKGKQKYMGVCKLPDTGSEVHLHRRIDLRMIPHEDYWCGLLYFTGSDFFNKQMRKIALERGFTLSEYSISPVGETGTTGQPLEINSEEDIFSILDMQYTPPEKRSL